MTTSIAKELAVAAPSHEDDEKDAPLRDDIRLLGRILGDTVREQEGADVYVIVERIRQASIRFHRDNESGARRELAATLDSLDNDQTLAIVRAFSYFSHLANIAEDQHHIRRNRAHIVRRSAPRPGSLAYAFQHARELGEALESPAQMEEFVLSHSDSLEASGFVQHLKLPHYVDFQSELELVRRMRREHAARGDEKP